MTEPTDLTEDTEPAEATEPDPDAAEEFAEAVGVDPTQEEIAHYRRLEGDAGLEGEGEAGMEDEAGLEDEAVRADATTSGPAVL